MLKGLKGGGLRSCGRKNRAGDSDVFTLEWEGGGGSTSFGVTSTTVIE